MTTDDDLEGVPTEMLNAFNRSGLGTLHIVPDDGNRDYVHLHMSAFLAATVAMGMGLLHEAMTGGVVINDALLKKAMDEYAAESSRKITLGGATASLLIAAAIQVAMSQAAMAVHPTLGENQ